MDYEVIEIAIRKIANGFIGYVDVRHGDYQHSRSPETFFPTLEEALATLKTFAANPENIIAAHPASDDHQPF